MDATDRFLTREQIDKLIKNHPHKIVLTTDALLSKVLTNLGVDHQLVGQRFPIAMLTEHYDKTIVLHLNGHIIDIRQIPHERPHSVPLVSEEYYKPPIFLRTIDLTNPDSITHLENFLKGTNHKTISQLQNE